MASKMNSKMTCFSMSPPKCRKTVGGLTYPKLSVQNYSHNNNLLSDRNNRNSPNAAGGGGTHSASAFGSCNNSNGSNSSNSHHFIVLKGLSHLVVTCRCVVRRIYFAIPWPWKARRKEKDPGSSGGAGGSNDEGKLYLQSALLEKHVNETELSRLVAMPEGIDENEWIASHTISLFEHVNLIYGTISEYCTSTTCPDMTAPCTRNYLWFDEKGKKVKVAAPQYIDYVMTFIQKTIMDESIFPTKSTNAFPSSFIPFVKKIFRLLFHVIAHIYHSHFRQIVLLSLHAHLNCVFAHFTMFNEAFKLVEEKETEVLQDLALAMKLKCDLIVEDDPMNSESNKENILSKSSSSQGVFPSSHAGSSGTSNAATSSTSSFSPTSEGSLLMKEPALVSISSGSR